MSDSPKAWRHFGCGDKFLPVPWLNTDLEVDIRQPLPYENESTEYIFVEQTCEHLTIHDNWKFFEEAYRVLATGGVLRVSVPDIEQFWTLMTDEYCRLEKEHGLADGSKKDTLRSMIFDHGHLTAWTTGLLVTVLNAIGFDAYPCVLGQSAFEPLTNIEQHGKSIGEHLNRQVSCAVEAVKR